MNLLSKTMFRREVDTATGDHVLRYRGPGKWVGRLYGYGPDVFFVVSPRNIPLPSELWPLADKSKLVLDQHPLVRPFTNVVIDALMAEALVQAPDLLEEYVASPMNWSEVVGITLEREHVNALSRVRNLVDEWKRDLERRIRLRELNGIEVHSPVEVPSSVVAQIITKPVVETKNVVAYSPVVIEKIQVAIRAAREAELPQRLPTGARRKLGRVAPGIYLVDMGSKDLFKDCQENLVSGLETGRTVAMTSEHGITVVDWDGEWPVVVRRFGSDGATIYKVEQATSRAGIEDKEETSEIREVVVGER